MKAIWSDRELQRVQWSWAAGLFAIVACAWLCRAGNGTAAEPVSSISSFLVEPQDSAGGSGQADATSDGQGEADPLGIDESGLDDLGLDALRLEEDRLDDFIEDGTEYRSIFGDRGERQARMADGRFELPPLMAPTTDVSQIGSGENKGRTPPGQRGEAPVPARDLPESAVERGFEEPDIVRTWAAPDTFFNPLYFEDRMLERHGHKRCGHYQSVAAGARFFATIPMLPYLMTVRPPCECEYSLGYFRAGSCAPKLLQRPPYERRAAIVEGASIAGAFLALP